MHILVVKFHFILTEISGVSFSINPNLSIIVLKTVHGEENRQTFLNHSWSGLSGLYSLRYGEKKD